MIVMQQVPFSSNIDALGYDPDELRLRVRFHSGGTYDYLGVSQKVWIEFQNSGSKGKYFFANIKGRYTTQKVEG